MSKALKSVLLAMAVLLAGAPGAGSAADLVIGRPVSSSAFDPGFLREAATVVDNLFDTLIGRAAQMKLVPGLALSWKAINDTTWELKLRQGVTFHNGEPFNAAAVKFTFDRVLDPAAKSPTISYIRTIAGVDVVDANTVRVAVAARSHARGRFSRPPSRLVGTSGDSERPRAARPVDLI